MKKQRLSSSEKVSRGCIALLRSKVGNYLLNIHNKN